MSEILIDMELIRLVGEIRRAVDALDGSEEAKERVGAAVERVDTHFDDSVPGFRDFLVDVLVGMAGVEPSDFTPTSRIGQGLAVAIVAVEECLIDPNAPGAMDMLAQAHNALKMALPEDVGAEALNPAPGAAAPSDETDAPIALISVLASDLVLADPDDKESLEQLQSTASDLASNPDLSHYQAELSEVEATLGKATRARKTDSREAALADATDQVSSLVDHITTSALSAAPEGEEKEQGGSTDALGDLELDASLDESSPALPEVQAETAPITQEPDRADTGSAVQVPSTDGSPPTAEEVSLPAGADLDLISDFVTEGVEYVENAEEALLALESDPADKEAVNDVFRAFHTIKGVSGFLELTWITHFAHYAENLLSQVRDGSVRFRGPCSELTLRATDVMKQLIAQVRSAQPGVPWSLPKGYAPVLEVLSDEELVDKLKRGEDVAVPSPFETDDDPADGGGSGKSRDTSAGSVRVKTDRLDRLVDLVGELVIAHSMLAAHPAVVDDQGPLAKTVDHSAKIMRELQDLSTGMRMVPLKPAFRKVSRVVRDVSKKMEKNVQLLTDGEDTEIDRTMVDVIADPLVHMVRNSLDHGLETTAERVAAGKPEQGTIRLRAYQAGGNVVVEIADDGAGLDRDKILAKAVERGVIDSGRNPTDSEVFNLIFEPGFSTADKVTDISGRGVGMDVVRRSVDSLRGRITIESELGKGSTFAIHLPLTLAITDGMLVAVGKEVYIIPTVKIQMSFRPKKEQISTVAGRGEMVSILDDLLPVVRLHRLYDVKGAAEELTEGLLLIVGEGTRRMALLVDELVNQQQFVVKALQGMGSATPGIAGAAILGNGDVGLILDPEELIQMARGNRGSSLQESVA